MKATEKQKEQCREYYKQNKGKILTLKKLYYQEHRDKILKDPKRFARVAKYRRAKKEKVLLHYGGGKLACVECGFTDIRALTIDHLDSGGCNHRKSVKSGSFYIWLAKQAYPEGYQTLCMNCQFIKRVEKGEYRWKNIAR